MIDFFMPEYVSAVMAERSKEAESTRILSEAANGRHRPRLRPRVAAVLAVLAARIHPEAARYAIGLRDPRANGPSGRHGWLCLCDD
jgi:hypothetical protein